MRITVLAGGYGGSKLSHGFALAATARRAAGGSLDLSVVINTGDDLEIHGLYVSPDLDTVMYTLGGWASDQGWGVRDETWSTGDMLARYGSATWFGLGDRDIGTHLVRTQGLRAGERLTTITGRLASSLGVEARLLPMTDDPVRTQLLTADGWLEFQEYFVHRHHDIAVSAVRHAGVEVAVATPEVLDAIASADLIAFAPSNPFVSIGTILAVPGIQEALRQAPAQVVAVSPIVSGAALRGPADQMFLSLAGEASASGFVDHYRSRYPDLVGAFVIDTLDAAAAPALEANGVTLLVTDTVMSDQGRRHALAEAVLARFLPGA